MLESSSSFFLNSLTAYKCVKYYAFLWVLVVTSMEIKVRIQQWCNLRENVKNANVGVYRMYSRISRTQMRQE